MYDEIVKAVEKREPKPDLMFITGYLAFKRDEAEYDLFDRRFFAPLQNALPGCPIFTVPGNHDVDRTASTKPRLCIGNEQERKLFQEISEAGARKRREILLPRFQAYHTFQQKRSAWNRDWLDSESGSICQEIVVGGRKLAIVGVNTAWLCQDDDGWGRLSAGAMVDAALRRASEISAELTIVLGHHPLKAMFGEDGWSDGSRIRLKLQQANAARPGEGALLGALLLLRFGEELKERVRGFLAPLRGRPGVNKHGLIDIYAMIAAMHRENQLYLTRSVLAFALGCDEAGLDRALRILQREAMLDSGESYLLTRHRRIAEAACEVLEDEGYDLNRWYSFLARAALHEFRRNHSANPDIAKWTYDLPSYFVRKGERFWPVARSIAQELFELEGNDPRLLVNFARVLRETSAPGQAMALLKEKGKPFKSHHSMLYEWSVVAGAIGDYGLNVWLAARDR